MEGMDSTLEMKKMSKMLLIEELLITVLLSTITKKDFLAMKAKILLDYLLIL